MLIIRQAIVLTVILVSGCTRPEGADFPYAGNTAEYRLGAGDQVRVLVFEQPALSNVYGVDASGYLSIPLVGAIRSENKTTRQLEAAIARQLKQRDLVADPKVAVEVAVYRPFSILGEVRTPGRLRQKLALQCLEGSKSKTFIIILLSNSASFQSTWLYLLGSRFERFPLRQGADTKISVRAMFWDIPGVRIPISRLTRTI